MKTTLKTFPDRVAQCEFEYAYKKDVMKWKEDFEAELREIQKNRPLGTNKDLVVVYVKEILGESE